MIEVEKKFRVNETVLGNLKSLGARLKKESSFTDVYYDDSRYSLTSQNFWLRQRDGLWQLKSPAGNRSADEALVNSSYKESESEADIVSLLVLVLCKTEDRISSLKKMNLTNGSGTHYSALTRLLHLYDCKPFCKITTRRQTYSLEEFNIDLDMTDSGYQIGEIELLAKGEESIASMARRIDNLSDRLGVPVEDQVSGKMGHYLKKHNPDHYMRLLKLKVLV